MRPTSVTVSSQTESTAIPINWREPGTFRVSLGCIMSAGANLTYKVQHTFDNIFDSTVTPTWLDHLTLVDKISSADGSYISPVTAVRLAVTTWVSGSVTLTVISGG